MKKLAVFTLCVLTSSMTFAADIEAGKAKTALCATCHGVDGIAISPIYPNLKGQNAQYLVKSMKAYKSGDRNDPVMSPMAATINDDDMENIAAYFESLK